MAFLRPERAFRKLIRESATMQAVLNADYTVAPMDAIPRNALMPYIGYRRISGGPEHHLTGPATSGMYMGSTEFYIFAETMDSAENIAEALRSVLDAKARQTVTIGSDSVIIDRLMHETEDVEAFYPADGSDSMVYVITQEYSWSVRT